MKAFALAVLFCLFPTVCLSADKKAPNPADYPITVHVVASHSRSQYALGNESIYQELKAVIDGVPVELEGNDRGVLALGDYRAKLVPAPGAAKDAPPYIVFRAYELLYPDGKTKLFYLSGFEPAAR
jgi:hypothetical protein